MSEHDEQVIPWTYKQFTNAMRNAGYKSLGQGVYQHERTGYKVQCFGYEAKNGCENWRIWAAKRQTPPPF